MPPTIACDFGDIVLVPFPFTDQSTLKKRPAVVVSSASYHRARPDLVVAAVSSQPGRPAPVGETPIAGWRQAGLLKPSFIKPILATVSRGIVLKRLGRLTEADRRLLGDSLRIWLGPA